MHTNRLARETSPYLLQHQHNPVDWHPWGPEAFDAARQQNKPIFLSVGYSTCYWCHVMERESFENEAIAKEMNQRFINIKVDREERPDVDQLYMTAVQVLTRHGGWPMSVFLLPDLRPFYGGTYFPPTDSHGRPGFVTILRAIEDAYHNRKADVEKSAAQLHDILTQLARPQSAARPIRIDTEFLHELIQRSAADYDPEHGGFGAAPKFPRETVLELLLTSEQSRDPARSTPVLHALDAMANGGIRDHLGGGFHRYSTDAQWLVPHFEIMLYDNAMLGWCYIEAYRQTENLRYARVARGIFDFVLREMTSPDGAFYTALDAEVDAKEGGSYLWTRQEIDQVLGSEDAALFCRVYGLDAGPNFADPHHGSGVPDQNVLYLPNGPELEDDPRIVECRRKLYEARRRRKQPLLDTKILTSWNALMIRALAYGGRILQEKRYLEAAERAAGFLLREHQLEEGSLIRTSRDGVRKHAAFLDDYAFLCQAMLALHDAGADADWREQARALSKVMLRKFWDEADGGFFYSDEDAKDLIVRQKVGTDSPLPAGNAVAAKVMLALDERDIARGTIEVFARQLQQQAESMSAMVEAAMLYVKRYGALEVEPSRQDAQDRPLSPVELAQRVVAVGTSWRNASQLEVRLSILKRYHINSSRPRQGMIPTELRVSGGEVDRIEYPVGETYDMQTSLLVHFKQPVVTPIRATLRYQACDESACLPEVTRTFDIAPAA